MDTFFFSPLPLQMPIYHISDCKVNTCFLHTSFDFFCEIKCFCGPNLIPLWVRLIHLVVSAPDMLVSHTSHGPLCISRILRILQYCQVGWDHPNHIHTWHVSPQLTYKIENNTLINLKICESNGKEEFGLLTPPFKQSIGDPFTNFD